MTQNNEFFDELIDTSANPPPPYVSYSEQKPSIVDILAANFRLLPIFANFIKVSIHKIRRKKELKLLRLLQSMSITSIKCANALH